jgi:hypothetical protein
MCTRPPTSKIRVTSAVRVAEAFEKAQKLIPKWSPTEFLSEIRMAIYDETMAPAYARLGLGGPALDMFKSITGKMFG